MTNKAKKTWGIILLICPFVGLIIVPALYAIASYILSANVYPTNVSTTEVGGSSLEGVVGQIVNGGLAVTGLFFLIALLIGTPIGIYLLGQSQPEEK